MKDVGVLINKEEIKIQIKNLEEKLKDLEKEIYILAGGEFLISSPKQLGVVLYDDLGLGHKIKKTKSGARSTNSDMLESIKNEHAIISKIILWREMSKVLNTYLTPLENYIGADGRVHPHFHQAGAATGRFSCENPNMQNLPRNTELGTLVRKVFVADTGYVFLSFDYSQIDLRSAALLSGDEKLLDIFKRGVDIHRGVAARVLHKKVEDITDEERRKAKAINFGILYGMGVNALKEAMGAERSEAQEFYNSFRDTFSTLIKYLEDVKIFAKKNGYTETLFKRQRQIPMIKSNIPFVRAQGERIAINAPVQGTSADILKLGMINVYEKIKNHNTDIKLILQIHDELVFLCKEGSVEEYTKIIKKELEGVLNGFELEHNTSLLVGVSSGKTLYEL
jgi:DNA polymerase I